MQQIQIATTAHSTLNVAANQLENRSLLYDKDENKLYIKYNDELRQISCLVDNDNIIINPDGEVALADDVHCRTMTVYPDDSGLKMHGNIVFGSTTTTRTILPLIKMSDSVFGAISGELYEKSNDDSTPLDSSYHFSISTTGSRTLSGASTGDKASFVNLTYKGEAWVGIKFPSGIPSTLYFHGFDYRPSEVIPTVVDDSEYASTAEISSDANFATKVVKLTPTVTEVTGYKDVDKSSYSWDFRTVPSGFTNSVFPSGWSGSWSGLGNDNNGVSFGNGLVLNTSRGTCVDTTSVAYGSGSDNKNSTFDVTNTGCIRFANSLSSGETSFNLTVDGKVKYCYVYFMSGSPSNRTCTITGLYKDGTISTYSATATAGGTTAKSPGTGTSYLNRVNYSDDIEGEHTITISHSGQMAIYLIKVATTVQEEYTTYEVDDPTVSDLTTLIEELPETGENGSPHQITFTMSETNLTYNDLVSIANDLKKVSTRVILDLSGCTTSYTTWSAAIFANCTSLYSLKLPMGITSLSCSDMFINTNLHVLTLNKDLSKLSTSNIFSGASIQLIDFRPLTTYPSEMAWHCLYGTTNTTEVWINEVIYTQWTTLGTNEYWNFGQNIGNDVDLNIGINGQQIKYVEDDVEWS